MLLLIFPPLRSTQLDQPIKVITCDAFLVSTELYFSIDWGVNKYILLAFPIRLIVLSQGHLFSYTYKVSFGCQPGYLTYAEDIMRNAGLDEAQAGITIAGRNINNLRYADDTTLMAESKEGHLFSYTYKVSFGCQPGYLTYAEDIMRNAGLDESQAGIKIAGRNINNFKYADNTTLMAESEELKCLLMKVKEESENVGLKLNIQKTKIMASGPITSW